MTFRQHYEVKEGDHAFLGASQYHWLNYDEDRLIQVYTSMLAKERGTMLHAFAAQCIKLGQKLPRSRKTLNMYVNDCIGFKMHPEQVLYYSENCFGTTDAISFRSGVLRISDLKSGVTKTSMNQLKIYAAIFCLEYRVDPKSIAIELRKYQNDEIEYEEPDPEEIQAIMNKIVTCDKILKRIQSEE